MTPNMLFSLVDSTRITAAKERSRQALTEHAQPRQPMNIKTNKKKLPISMLDDILDAPSNRSSLPREQSVDSHLHLQDTMEVVLEQEVKFL